MALLRHSQRPETAVKIAILLFYKGIFRRPCLKYACGLELRQDLVEPRNMPKASHESISALQVDLQRQLTLQEGEQGRVRLG